jgi:hypothetical protein
MGFNFTTGGEGGFEFSRITKYKLSLSRRGRKVNRQKYISKSKPPLLSKEKIRQIKLDSNQNKESASRSKDFGKRVLSPNSSSTQAQFNRAEKRIRHNQEMSGPSIFSSLPTHKTARSSVPRKPALPSFSSTTTRSSSAPKTRPVVQEQRYNFHRKKSQINQENMKWN